MLRFFAAPRTNKLTPSTISARNVLPTPRVAPLSGDLYLRALGWCTAPPAVRLVNEDHHCSPTAAYPVSKLAAERFLLGVEGLDVRVLRLPFVYGDGDPHIKDVIPIMRGFPPTHRMSLGHHVDIAQAVTLLLDAPSPAHRIYNVVDDEAPNLATLFASVGEPPPNGSDAEKRGPSTHCWTGAGSAKTSGSTPVSAPRRRACAAADRCD